jgi:hypothetical protein
MAISFVGASAVVTGSIPTLPLPAGVVGNDLLIIISSGTSTPATPGGWTLLSAQGAGQFITVLYNYANGNDTSQAISSLGTSGKAVMLAYRDAGAFQLVPAYTTGTGTTATPNTLTTTYANDFVVSIYASAQQVTVANWTPNGSTTSRVNSSNSSSAKGLLIADELQAAAGVSTARAATLSASNTWASVAIAFVPTRTTVYWVGGAGTWNTTTATNWSDSSGGSGGALPPAQTESAVFDSASNGTSYTVTISGSQNCNNLTINQPATGSITFSGSFSLSINGSVLAGSTVGQPATNNEITFKGPNTGRTWNWVGWGLPAINFSFAHTGDITLASNIGNGGNRSFSFTSGTFSASTFNVINSNNGISISGTAVINMGSGTWSSTSSSFNAWAATSPATINAQTSTINLTGSSPIFAGGGYTYNNLSISSTILSNTALITGTNTFNNLTFAVPASDGCYGWDISANQTINGNLTTSGLSAVRRVWLRSNTLRTPRTLTVNAFSGTSDIDFRDITIAGAAAGTSITRGGDCQGNSGITFPAAKTVYWNLAGAQNINATGWAPGSGGTPAVNNFPLAQDTAVFDNAGAAGAVTFMGNYQLGAVDMSGRTSAMSFTVVTNAPGLYGNFLFGTGVTSTSNGIGFFTNSNTTQTVTSNGVTAAFPWRINNVNGALKFADNHVNTQALVYTQGGLDVTDVSLTVPSLSSSSTTRNIIFGSTGNITLNGSGSVISMSGTSFTYTGTPTINVSNNSATATSVTLSSGFTQTNALNVNYTTGTYTLTDANAGYKNLNLTGFNGTFQSPNTARTIYGNLTLDPSLGTYSVGTNANTFAATSGTQTITSNTRTFPQNITINGAGGTVQLVDALTLGSTNTFTVTAGTFNTSNQNVTVGLFSGTGSTTRTITLGTSTINLSGTGTVWNFATPANLTFSGASSTINLTNTTTTDRTFSGGGLTYGTLSIGGATGTSTTTIDTGIFSTLSSIKTVAHTIRFSASTTITNWTVTGTVGNVVTVDSNISGTLRSITYGGGQINLDYMSIRDINFSYTLGASNPYLVYAGANSTNSGNNSGIAFIDGTTQKAYRLTTGTAWTVPADWNSASNTIYLIGAGGGGATPAVSGNNRAAGGGGGGGGYTALTNQSLTPAASIPYTIGTSAANSNGGSTTFNTTNIAGGGLRGTATTVPLSTGGVGGTGANANGGTGGAGAFGIIASTGYGAGGSGGAGGPNGIGGNGGNGFGSTNVTNIAGGGGGGNGGGSAGGNASSATGGVGGNNFSGVGGGTTNGALGTVGGGGAGNNSSNAAGMGGSGIDIQNTIGGSGGKGGSGIAGGGGNTGIYGGGGAGSGITTAGGFAAGGSGSQGVIFIVYTPGGTAFTASITEGSTFADVSDALIAITGSVIEALGVADTADVVAAFASAIAENINVADASSVIAAFNSAVSEALSVADAQNAASTLNVSITEEILAAEIDNFLVITFTGVVSEALTVTDIESVITAFAAAISENTTIEDTASVLAAFNSDITEPITVEDTESVVASFIGVITEDTQIADTPSAIADFAAAIVEAAQLADINEVVLTINTDITEDITLDNSQTVIANFASVVFENINLADDPTVIASFSAVITEDTNLADLQEATAAFVASLAEAITVEDSSLAVRIHNSDITEILTLADDQTALRTHNTLISENIFPADAITVIASFNSQITENLVLLDEPFPRGWYKIDDTQAGDWAQVNNAESSTWASIDDNQTVVWTKVNNSYP